MDAKKSLPFYTYWAVFIASLGGFLQSYVTCAIAGSLAFIAGEFSLSSFHQGNLASIILFGALIGSCGSGFLADRWGRRRSLQLSAALFLLSSVGVFFVGSLSSLLALRFMAGLATGITSILVPLYLAEIAPASSRGAFVTTFQFAVTIGTLIAYLINFFFESSGNWRAMLSFSAPIAAFQLVSLCVFPESPKWLFSRDQFDAGNLVLHRLQGITLGKSEVSVEPRGSSLKALFKHKFRQILFIGLILSVFQQLSGINAVIYFTPKIFAEGGITHPMFSTILVGIINIIATFISLFLIDRFGRKKLLLFSQVGVIASLLPVILSFAIESEVSDLIGVIAVLTYVASYSLGMGPITWVLISEIYPFQIRAQAMAVMTFLSWLTNYFIVLSFPLILVGWGAVTTFSLYLFFGVVGFFLFFRFVPETKGKSLEDLEKENS